MRRFHLFEIHDQHWCPRVVRDGLTDYLAQTERGRQIYTPILALIVDVAQESSTSQIIDLCSGGGGPWISWLPSGACPSIRSVILTDKFPNDVSSSKLLPERVTYSLESVDASRVPPELLGFRTLFSSFHHFQPDAARAILRDACSRGQPIGVFEFTNRSLPTLLMMLLTIFSVWATMPQIRPVRVSRLILTYLLPIIPFVVMIDGIISCLRTYTPAELRQMANEAAPDFFWEAGLVRKRAALGFPVTYLIGTPR